MICSPVLTPRPWELRTVLSDLGMVADGAVDTTERGVQREKTGWGGHRGCLQQTALVATPGHTLVFHLGAASTACCLHTRKR